MNINNFLTTIAMGMLILLCVFIDKSTAQGNPNDLKYVTHDLTFERPCPNGWLHQEYSQKCYKITENTFLGEREKDKCKNMTLPFPLKANFATFRTRYNMERMCETIRTLSSSKHSFFLGIVRDGGVWKWERSGDSVEDEILEAEANSGAIGESVKYGYLYVRTDQCRVRFIDQDSLSNYQIDVLCEIWNINSCIHDNGGCHEGDLTRCVKIVPGVNRCDCRHGFEELADDDCIDIDECADNNGGCGTKFCINQKGSHECSVCYQGFELKESTCVDINECTNQNSTHNCKDDFKCLNEPGNFICVKKPARENNWLILILVFIVATSAAACLFLTYFCIMNKRRERLKAQRRTVRHSIREVQKSIGLGRHSVGFVPAVQTSKKEEGWMNKIGKISTQIGAATSEYFKKEDVVDRDQEELKKRTDRWKQRTSLLSSERKSTVM